MTDAITLAIEVSNPSSEEGRAGDVAVGLSWRGGARVLGSAALPAGARHDGALLPAIDEACRAAGVGPRGLARVAVSAGPGGFTGLRIAVAAAKMIAEATGARTAAVPSALVAAWEAVDRVGPGRALVVLASKRGTGWGVEAALRPGHEPRATVGEGRLVTAEDAAALHASAPLRAVIADAHLAGPIRAWAEGAGVPVVAPALRAAWCLAASAWVEDVDPAALAPIYPREPEAVTKWRELGRDVGPATGG